MDVERLERQRLDVRNWRFDEAKAAGLTPVEAMMFAESDADLNELRKLVRKGATPLQIREIVL